VFHLASKKISHIFFVFAQHHNDTDQIENSEPERIANNRWFIGYFLSNMAGGVTTPLIPLFVIVYLGSNVFYMGITTSSASAASVLALIFWGNVSDYLRKRKIFIIIGFVGSFASLMMIMLVHTIAQFILIMVLFQLVAMASVPISTLILIENSKESKWPVVMSRFNQISAVGTVVGLIMGTVIISLYSSSSKGILLTIYEISAILYLLAAISVFIFINDPNRTIGRRRLWMVNSIRMVERIRYFPSNVIHFITLNGRKKERNLGKSLMLYLFSSSFLMLGFQIFFVPYPVFLINRLGASEALVFVMYLSNAIFSALTYIWSGNALDRFGSRKVLSVSLLARILIFLGMAGIAYVAVENYIYLIVSIAIYGILGGIWSFIGISQITTVSHLAPKTLRGKAVGYYNSFNGIGQILGSFVSGIVALYFGYSIDFILAASVVIVASVIALRSVPGIDNTETPGKTISSIS
jgi:MFS family permease